MVDPNDYCFYCMSMLPAPNGVCPKCGKDNRIRVNANTDLPFARLAGKYIVGHPLGRGGFGITYAGLNGLLGKRVAIKEYFPKDICQRSENHIKVITSAEDTERFEAGKRKALEEARTISGLSGIPNVVRAYDCFSRNNTLYIIMEYIDGECLSSAVAQRGALKWREAWVYMRPIAEALNTVHLHGLIHGDISPDNIMVRENDGQPVLLDFGAAAPSEKEGRNSSILSKEGYSAPEQYYSGSQIDGRSDEYAWCATMYYLLTGTRPVGASQRRFDENSLKLPRKLHSDIPAAAQTVLMKGMSLEQSERYATMRELIDALDAISPQDGQGGGAGRIMLRVGAAAAACVCGLMIYAGQQKLPPVVRAEDGALVYDKPTGTILTKLEQETLLSVHDSSREGEITWYKVCIPQKGTLQTCYVSGENVEELDRNTYKKILEDNQISVHESGAR